MAAPSPFPSTRRAAWMAGAALAIAVALVYANSLGAPFVYDDTAAILGNPSIRKLWPLTDVLLPQAEGGLTVSGRPVLNLSFAVSYALSGERVWAYHVFNILVHAGAACLVFGIVRRTRLRQAYGGQAPGWSGLSPRRWLGTDAGESNQRVE